MNADPRPACDEKLVGGDFVEPTIVDVGSLDPCKFCFPDGEINVDADDLLVGSGANRRRKVHRHESTGELTYEYPENGGPKLAYKLQDPDFGPEDLGLGGDPADD